MGVVLVCVVQLMVLRYFFICFVCYSSPRLIKIYVVPANDPILFLYFCYMLSFVRSTSSYAWGGGGHL